MEPTFKEKKGSATDLTKLVYGKVPPQAKQLEELVLGAMMLDKNVIPVLISRLFKEVFYSDINQRIYGAIVMLYDKSREVDLETVIYQLKANGDLDIVGGSYSVSGLTLKISSTANIEVHVSILLELYLKREAIRISAELLNEGYEDGSDAFDIVSKASNEFIKAQERIVNGATKDMSYYVMKLAENRQKILEGGAIGIPTGFTELDKIIGGWVKPDLIVIAARPGMGKTALMLSTLHTISVKQNRPGAVFSLEMNGEQLTERLEAIDSNIFHKKLRHNDLNDYDKRILSKSELTLSTAPIYIEDRAGLNIRDLRTKATLLKRKYNIEYILIDYLQLMSGVDERGKNREQVISDISRGCKQLAKELEVPVIALSQLSRAVESRSDKMPQLSDLRESGAIEQDADEVIFLMRPEYYDFKQPIEISGREYETNNLVICKIDKNRHGATQNIALRFHPEIMKYSNYEEDNSSNYRSAVPHFPEF